MEYRIGIVCRGCNEKLTIKAKEQALGKSVNLRCPKCNHEIHSKIPTKQIIEGAMEVENKQPPSNMSIPTEILSNVKSKSLSYYLEVIPNEETTAQKLDIDQPYLSFGRLGKNRESSKADLLLQTNDICISRLHCIFRTYEDGVTVEDKSNNGTFLKGKRLFDQEEIHLNDGDILKMGNTLFKFKAEKN